MYFALGMRDVRGVAGLKNARIHELLIEQVVVVVDPKAVCFLWHLEKSAVGISDHQSGLTCS